MLSQEQGETPNAECKCISTRYQEHPDQSFLEILPFSSEYKIHQLIEIVDKVVMGQRERQRLWLIIMKLRD